MLTVEDATALAERVKRSTRNSDILDLCDLVLLRSPLNRPPPAPPVPPKPRAPKRVREKTAEQKRRDTETARARMRKMRAKDKAAAKEESA